MMIRYLHEDGLKLLPSKYFKLREQIKDYDPFYLVQMACICLQGNNNHSIRDFNQRYFLSKEEFEKRTNVHKASIYVSGGISVSSLWNKIISNANIKDPQELYKHLINPQFHVYVVGGSKGYANWLPDVKFVNNVEKADLVLFTGGEDVDPSFYGEPKNKTTHSNIERDKEEKIIFEESLKLEKPMLGICRGAQFLCVMCGGKLVQDQPNPEYIHGLKSYNYGAFNITSTHHQAAYPYNLPSFAYKIIAWTENHSKYHHDGNNNELNPKRECEIVYYNGKRCLGIQGHPESKEWQEKHPESLATIKKIFEDFINKKLR